jgi:hypothetical protein
MPINRSVKKLTALVLVGAAVAAASETATDALAAQSGARPASALPSLSSQERQYVTGVASLSDAQLAAAFGARRISDDDQALASLTPKQRRYVRAIASMSYEQLAAAFGTER